MAMTRNVVKQAETGKKQISITRDMTANELNQLLELARNPKDDCSLWTALATAYYFGFHQGLEQKKAERKVRS